MRCVWLQVASMVDMVEGYSDKAKVSDEELSRRIDHDPYMKCAVSKDPRKVEKVFFNLPYKRVIFEDGTPYLLSLVVFVSFFFN